MQVILLTLTQSYLLYHQVKIFNYAKEIEKEIIKEKEAGVKNVIIKQIEIKTNRLVNYLAIFNNTEDDRNRGVAKYYGLKTIKAIDLHNL